MDEINRSHFPVMAIFDIRSSLFSFRMELTMASPILLLLFKLLLSNVLLAIRSIPSLLETVLHSAKTITLRSILFHVFECTHSTRLFPAILRSRHEIEVPFCDRGWPQSLIRCTFPFVHVHAFAGT